MIATERGPQLIKIDNLLCTYIGSETALVGEHEVNGLEPGNGRALFAGHQVGGLSIDRGEQDAPAGAVGNLQFEPSRHDAKPKLAPPIFSTL